MKLIQKDILDKEKTKRNIAIKSFLLIASSHPICTGMKISLALTTLIGMKTLLANFPNFFPSLHPSHINPTLQPYQERIQLYKCPYNKIIQSCFQAEIAIPIQCPYSNFTTDNSQQ